MSDRATELAARGLRELPLVVVSLLLLGAAAEILPPDTLVSVGEVKFNLERLLVLAGLAALVASARPAPSDLRTGLAIPIAVLLAAGLVATIKWGTEPRYRFLVEAAAVFYLVVGVVRTRPDARTALAAVALVALAIPALSGLAQVAQADATGFYRQGCEPVELAPPIVPDGSLTRAVGSFENPNVLAGALLLLLPVGIGAAAGARQRLPALVVVGLGFLALVLTLSRAAVVAGFLALALVALASRWTRRREIAAGAAVAGVIAALALGTCGADTASGDFGRIDTWRETVELGAEEPVTGVGLGRTADRLRQENPDSTFRHGHDLWLTWWADAGTAALLAWLAIAAILLWRAFTAARRGDALSLGLLGSLVAFLVYSVGDHPANVDRVALIFWTIAGLVAAGAPARERTADA